VFFSKTTKRICANFFQGLGESTCLLQPALKSTAPGTYSNNKTNLSATFYKQTWVGEQLERNFAS